MFVLHNDLFYSSLDSDTCFRMLSFVELLFISLLAENTWLQGQKFSICFSYSQALSLANCRALSAPRRMVPNTTVIAGVTVVDTPLVRDAQSFAREHMLDSIYSHVMRLWLLSATIINAKETLHDTVDLEVHAIASPFLLSLAQVGALRPMALLLP